MWFSLNPSFSISFITFPPYLFERRLNRVKIDLLIGKYLFGVGKLSSEMEKLIKKEVKTTRISFQFRIGVLVFATVLEAWIMECKPMIYNIQQQS